MLNGRGFGLLMVDDSLVVAGVWVSACDDGCIVVSRVGLALLKVEKFWVMEEDGREHK